MSEQTNTLEIDELTPTDIEELDLSTPEWTRLLSEAPIFAKKGFVEARPAIPGEAIETILADGTVETDNTALEGDSVITNPGGEEYIIPADRFAQRYEPTEKPGIYKAIGLVRAIKNPTGHSIKIQTSWGEQVGEADCWITAAVDPNDFENLGPGRIVGAQEFAETYGIYEEVYGPLEVTAPK